MNNFNSSTSGVNLELSCFFDSHQSSYLFDENFTRINDDTFLFIDHGNFSNEFDLSSLDNYDLSSCFVREIKQYFIEHVSDYKSDLNELAYNYFEKRFNQLLKNELLEILTNELDNDDLIDFLNDNFKAKFEKIIIQGYSQGDQVTVIFKHKDMKEYNFDNRDIFINNMKNYIYNLFYDAPLFCKLTIDNIEFYFNDYIKNEYNYDKSELLSIASEHIKHDKKDIIMQFLNDNLTSEYPDYE